MNMEFCHLRLVRDALTLTIILEISLLVYKKNYEKNLAFMTVSSILNEIRFIIG